MAKPTLSSMTCRSSRGARSITGTFVVTTLLAACAPGDGGLGMDVVRRDSAGITIVENRTPTIATRRLGPTPLLTVGEGGPVEQTPLDPMAGFFADDGRIIVGDGNQVGWDAVLVYDAAGQFLMKLGGSGRGPGEFGGQLWWAGPYRGDSIVAWDRRGPTGPSIKSTVQMGDFRGTSQYQGYRGILRKGRLGLALVSMVLFLTALS